MTSALGLHSLVPALILVVIGIVFAVAIRDLVGSFVVFGRFGESAESLKGSSSWTQVVWGTSELERLADSFLQSFELARQKRTLPFFNIDRGLALVSSRFAAMVSRPRSVAGILIIGGLLVTL